MDDMHLVRVGMYEAAVQQLRRKWARRFVKKAQTELSRDARVITSTP